MIKNDTRIAFKSNFSRTYLINYFDEKFKKIPGALGANLGFLGTLDGSVRVDGGEGFGGCGLILEFQTKNMIWGRNLLK